MMGCHLRLITRLFVPLDWADDDLGYNRRVGCVMRPSYLPVIQKSSL
jgi:hypothetical protein